MGKIHILEPHIANQIAAGEVVERPSSVVKELVENAIDASADSITVEIENGGMHRIAVTDNGVGIAKEDCRNAFLRHATSKIETTEDLSQISTLGFRGEALASIASVARVCMTTRVKDSEAGTKLVIDNGTVVSEEEVACVYGTSFSVEALFASVPARLRFLKSPRTEAGYIGDYMARMILARPDISFRYISDGKTIYQTYGDGDLYNALYCVYGKTIAEKVVPVAYDNGYIRVDGFVGLPEISRSNRTYQTLLLNGRYIRSFAIAASVLQAYDTRMMIGKFPFFVLSLTLSPSEFDVNVHPTKLEVRFADEQRVWGAVKHACRDALDSTSQHVESALDACMPGDVRADAPIDQASPLRSDVTASRFSYGPVRQSYSMQEPPMENSFSRIGTSGSVPVYQVKPADSPRYASDMLLSDSPIEIVGCAFRGYWIVTRDDMLYIIDQHAAHERKIFEQLTQREISIASQPLLVPYAIRLTPSESDTLQTHMEELNDIGYRFENAASLSVTVLAVPVLNGVQLRDAYLHEALSILSEQRGNAADQLVRERLMQSSCKHAIKVGEPITKQEIAALLQEYLDGEAPLTCPHGRPILIRITKNELEKMFRRIV